MAVKQLTGDLYIDESSDHIRFGNAFLELVFSKNNGWWTGFSDLRAHREWSDSSAEAAPPLLLRVGGKSKRGWLVRNSRVYDLENAREIGYKTLFSEYRVVTDVDTASLEIDQREGNWILTCIYRLAQESDTLIRDLRLTYLGPKEVLLRDVRLLVPPIQPGKEEAVFLEAPGYPVPPHILLASIPEGIWPGLESRPTTFVDRVQHSVDAPGSVAGLVAISDPDNETGLMCWPYSTSEFIIQELEKLKGAVRLVTWMTLADRFTCGHTVEAGRQYLHIFHGPWSSAMQDWQKWFEPVGLATPIRRPDWTNGAAIYEVHIGRAPFLGGISYEPYPYLADLVDDLPRIAGLGFEVIQVMPHWPFCGYTVHDYHQIEHQYGEPAQLKALTRMAHQMGLHVILDVVLHGCVDREIIRWDMSMLDPRFHFIFGEWLKAADERSHYRDEHPEWFMQDEDGNTARIYTWAFDHLNPSFQEFLIGTLRYYLDEFDVDGFRFDAPSWNCIPNWKPGLPYRASESFYGSHALMRRIRQEIKAAYPQALLYTEPSGPLYRSTMDLTYNYDEEWLSGSLVEIVSERGFAGARYYTGQRITARQIAEWLQDRRLSLPAGSQTVHHLDSHDTFWWGEKAQFRYEAFGVGASRALFAMFALLDGGIMNYVGAEKGSEDFYRNLLHLRQDTPALRVGTCDYLAVQAEPEMVLPLLRSQAGEHYIPVINLSPLPVYAQLKLPIEKLGLKDGQAWSVYDVLNHEPIATEGESEDVTRSITEQAEYLAVRLPAYGVRVLQIQAASG